MAAISSIDTSCSRMSRRTAGERCPGRVESPSAAGASGADAGGVASAGAGAGAGASGAAADAGAAAAGTGAAPSTAISVPTSTVVPSATVMASSTPSAGEGISTLILSVWISTSGSSRRTRSPTCFSHRETVPSATLSPSWGTTIEMDIAPPLPAGGRGRGRGAGGLGDRGPAGPAVSGGL